MRLVTRSLSGCWAYLTVVLAGAGCFFRGPRTGCDLCLVAGCIRVLPVPNSIVLWAEIRKGEWYRKNTRGLLCGYSVRENEGWRVKQTFTRPSCGRSSGLASRSAVHSARSAIRRGVRALVAAGASIFYWANSMLLRSGSDGPSWIRARAGSKVRCDPVRGPFVHLPGPSRDIRCLLRPRSPSRVLRATPAHCMRWCRTSLWVAILIVARWRLLGLWQAQGLREADDLDRPNEVVTPPAQMGHTG